jgi:hypothetical protein
MIERPARFWAMIHEWSTPSPTAAKSSNEEELPALNKSQRRVLAPIRVIPGDAGKVDPPDLPIAPHAGHSGEQRGHHEYRPEIVILRFRLCGEGFPCGGGGGGGRRRRMFWQLGASAMAPYWPSAIGV